MTQNDSHHELDDLGKKIRAAQGISHEKPQDEVSPNNISMAWRISIELVAGVAVGGVIGYYIDSWLGSSPIGLMLGIGLGAVAGFRNMTRSINNSMD